VPRGGTRLGYSSHRDDERGFALVEVIVSAVIAVVAVIGLSYSFSVGRVQIDRFEVARAALAVAQERMERLSILSASHALLVARGAYHPDSPIPFQYKGAVGWIGWLVEWFDDPATSDTQDLKRVTVRITWTQNALNDTLRLSRLFPAR
jgi:hypothetical protein